MSSSALKFETFQTNNYVFQETPKVGDYVMIAIKPYTGKYEKGKKLPILWVCCLPDLKIKYFLL